MSSSPSSKPSYDTSSADSVPKGATYWYDGQPVVSDTITIPIDDPGLLRGVNLFTTLRVHHTLDHPATQWPAHCDRLRTTIETFNFTPPNWDHIRAGAEYIHQHYPVVRILVFPNGIEWITGRLIPSDLDRKHTEGITAWLAPPEYQRAMPQYKSTSYLASWIGDREGRARNAEATILTNPDGHWLETTTGSLWGYRDGQWWVPPQFTETKDGRPLAQRLSSTTQNFIIQLLEKEGQTVGLRPWTPDWVPQLEAITYGSTITGAVPIRRVLDSDGRSCWQNPEPGPADELLKLWKRAIAP